MKHKKIYENGKYVPQRMCVACREIRPKADMLRVAFSNGTVTLDAKGNGCGRGAYVCNNTKCIEKAQKIRALERGLKTNVPDGLYEECLNFEK